MAIKPNIGFYKTLFFLLFVLGFVGCSSTKIAINVVRPPETPFSQKVESIALINGVGVANAKTNQFMNGRVVAQFNGSTDYLVKNTFTQMEAILNNGQYFNVFDTTLNFLPKRGGFNSNSIPSELMSRACFVLKTDAIVTVEGYTADIDTDSDVRYSTPVDRNYGMVRVPYFDGEQNVDMRMLFRAYLCTDNSGKMDSQAEVGTQISKSTTGSSRYEVRSRLQGSGSILLEASDKIAIDYSSQIGPRREMQSRRIYSKGFDQMEEAFKLAGFGNWEGANDIWYLLATSNNMSVAGKATYNLILGNEVLGNYTEAFQLAKICMDKYEMNHVQSYLETLKIRESEMQEVYRLFPSIIL